MIDGLCPLCPYCGEFSELADSAEIYNGVSYGPIYICRDCEAWVGCHEGTTRPKGTLADKDLRELRVLAHEYFDPIWRSGGMKRQEAYQWLSEQLGIPREDTHIGMFDDEWCLRVIEICMERMEATP